MGDMADYYADLALLCDVDPEYDGVYEAEDLHRGIWTTKGGQRIHISKMETSHLRNTIRYIERTGHGFDDPDGWLDKLRRELRRREDNAVTVPRS